MAEYYERYKTSNYFTQSDKGAYVNKTFAFDKKSQLIPLSAQLVSRKSRNFSAQTIKKHNQAMLKNTWQHAKSHVWLQSFIAEKDRKVSENKIKELEQNENFKDRLYVPPTKWFQAFKFEWSFKLIGILTLIVGGLSVLLYGIRYAFNRGSITIPQQSQNDDNVHPHPNQTKDQPNDINQRQLPNQDASNDNGIEADSNQQDITSTSGKNQEENDPQHGQSDKHKPSPDEQGSSKPEPKTQEDSNSDDTSASNKPCSEDKESIEQTENDENTQDDKASFKKKNDFLSAQEHLLRYGFYASSFC